MSKTKHTPGPWMLKSDDSQHSIYGIDGYMVSSIPSDDEYGRTEEDIANAHLIAASPELLAALKLVANHFLHPELRKVTGQTKDGVPSSVSIEMTMSTVKYISDAIAKAEGKNE